MKIIYQISTGKIILFTDIKAGGRIAPHILNLDAIQRCVIRFTPKSLYAPVTHLIRAEWASQPGGLFEVDEIRLPSPESRHDF